MLPQLPEGYTVKFRHTRNKHGQTINPGSGTISPRGGTTHAFVYDAERNLVATGYADCNEKDNYNKKIGRDISLGRALKELGPRS